MIRRYRHLAATLDYDQFARSPIIRDGIRLLSRIPLRSAELIDVGCAFGQWSQILRRCPEPLRSWRYAGTEVTPDLVALCQELYPAESFSVGRAESLPFPAGRFDIVLSSGVLPCVRDWRAGLRDHRRVAKSYVALLRIPVVRYAPSTLCEVEVRSTSGQVEHHPIMIFAREELEHAFHDAGLSLLEWDYTDEINAVEGIAERVFSLNFLLQPA